MSLELNLRFPDPEHVGVYYDGRDSNPLDFKAPLDDKAQDEIRWYLETYTIHDYTTDVDGETAGRIEAKLPQWGEALFEAVFASRAASRLFNDFQEYGEPGRVLTIDSDRPEILSLPWELLRDPEGTFLCHEDPRISVRRFSGHGRHQHGPQRPGDGAGHKPARRRCRNASPAGNSDLADSR